MRTRTPLAMICRHYNAAFFSFTRYVLLGFRGPFPLQQPAPMVAWQCKACGYSEERKR